MGDPRRLRKAYETPRHPWRKDQIEAELKLLGEYGLRNKRELWRAKTFLSKVRGMARSILGMADERRNQLENQLIAKLRRLGLVGEEATIDDVLSLTVRDVLERRLQTVVYKKGFAKTPHQARQLITHGHISLGDKKVTVPGYLVGREEEGQLGYSKDSALAEPTHPLREATKV